MSKKRGKTKFLDVLNSKPVIGALIFIMLSLATVVAGDVIVKEGDSYFDGNVGIGTTSPGAGLDVDTGALSGSSSPVIIWARDGAAVQGVLGYDHSLTDVYIGSLTNHALQFRTNDAIRMFIENSGNVGIGTTSPQKNLHVLDTGTAGTPAPDTGAVGVFQRSGTTTDDSIIQIISGATGEAHVDFGDTGDANIGRIVYDNNVNDLSLWTLNTERVTIDSSGNVGIGITSPATILEVSGVTRLTNAAGSAQLQFRDSTNSKNRVVQNNNGDLMFGATDSDPDTSLDFIIKDGGNIGIGTTSPDRRLAVETDDGTNYSSTNMGFTKEGLIITNNPGSDTTNYAALTFQAAGGGTNGWGMIGLVREGTDRADMVFGTRQASGNIIEAMRITKTGNVGIGTTSPGATRLNVSALGLSGTNAGAFFGDGDFAVLFTEHFGGGSDRFAFFTKATGSAEAIRTDGKVIITNGNLGVGETNPSDALTVIGDVNITGCYQLSNGTIIGGSCVSGREYKTNEEPFIINWTQFNLVVPKTFDWKQDSITINKTRKVFNQTSGKSEIENYSEILRFDSKGTGFIYEDVISSYPERVNIIDGVKRVIYGFDWIFENRRAIQELKQENDMLKSELCKKDATYSWC